MGDRYKRGGLYFFFFFSHYWINRNERYYDIDPRLELGKMPAVKSMFVDAEADIDHDVVFENAESRSPDRQQIVVLWYSLRYTPLKWRRMGTANEGRLHHGGGGWRHELTTLSFWERIQRFYHLHFSSFTSLDFSFSLLLLFIIYVFLNLFVMFIIFIWEGVFSPYFSYLLYLPPITNHTTCPYWNRDP